MKDSGACPKCAATDVVRIPGEEWSVLAPRPNVVPVGRLGGVLVTRYVCCGCGYSEEWVESADARQKLKSRYGPPPEGDADRR